MGKRVKLLIRATISILLLVLIFLTIDFSDFVEKLQKYRSKVIIITLADNSFIIAFVFSFCFCWFDGRFNLIFWLV